jgi:pimeloyl-ACP methyl ester carboxylesterase
MAKTLRTALLLLLAGLRPAGSPARADDTEAVDEIDALPNLKARTLGGKQLWSDVVLFHDWRIQRHVLTGHHRLLDGANKRQAWGTLAACQQRLAQARRQSDMPPMRGKAVILLHGLVRSRACMRTMADYLEREGGYVPFEVGYPSTRAEIGEHAAALASVIEHLDGVDEINFVTHSLGSLVVRHYLADQTDPATGRRPDPRIRRIVMLGPPNHGSPLADPWINSRLFHAVLGPSGDQIAAGPDNMADRLAVPACEFGIVAGGRGKEVGYNPWLEGDNDSTVPVASTRLAGARDFVVLPVLHSFLISDPTALEYTLRFLQYGHFISDEARRPIEAEGASPAVNNRPE